ncbi:MAG: tetratricopeptide repeat protein, partial [bacterium]
IIALVIALGLSGSKLDKANQLVLLGNVYRDAFIADEARRSYEEALSENPMCIEAYIGISRSYTSVQNSSDALEVLDEAIKNGIDDPRLLIEKASLLVALGQKEEAIDLALTLAESHPLLPRLNELLGALLFEQGETRTGIEYLEKEIQYGIPSPMTYGILGRAYLQTGDYHRAAENLEKAISVRTPGIPMASLIMMLADAYTELGYHLKACNLLYQVARNDVANIPLGLKFASSLYNASRYKDALMELKHLRQFQPSNTDILLKMGETYVQLDSLDQAHNVWQEVLKIDPGNSIAKEKLKESGK